MNEVQQDIMCVLLQTLLDKELITQDIHDKSRNKILGTLDLLEFFWDNDGGKEDAHGCEKNPC
ncbi:MAG: hypothetical protein ACI4PH_08005 [Faecousia sp.]